MKKAMINYMQTDKNDELYTPAYAVKPLLKYIPSNVKKIWCPCDTMDSQIVKVLQDAGYVIITSHISQGGDFFTYCPNEEFDMIITNPPYSIKDEMLERCYSFCKPFSLLLPLTALEGIKRGKMYRKHGISVIVMDQRAEFTGKNGVWFNTSWFISHPFFCQ